MSFLTSAFSTRPSHHVLILGGSYAGLVAVLSLLRLLDGIPEALPFAANTNAAKARPVVKGSVKITLLDERDGFFHTIGAPLAHASPKYAPTAWIPYKTIPWLQDSRVAVKQGTVKSIDCAAKAAIYRDVQTGQVVSSSYDFLVAATGMRRDFPIVPAAFTKDQYLHEAKDHIKTFAHSDLPVAVVGGGAVGIEFAAEIKDTFPQLDVKLIHSRAQLLSAEKLPDDFKDKVLESLHATGVETILSKRVLSYEKPFGSSDSDPARTLILDDGTRIKVGKVINCAVKFHPNTSYLPPNAVDSDGFINITPNLNFTDHPSHFAVGDIAHWSGIKRCGMAMHMGMTAGANIHALIVGKEDSNFDATKEMDAYPEVPPMIGLAIGKIGAGYSPEGGIMIGEEFMQQMFGTDLGFTICSTFLNLTGDIKPADSVATTTTTEPEQPTEPQVPEDQTVNGVTDNFAASSLKSDTLDTSTYGAPVAVDPVAEAIKA